MDLTKYRVKDGAELAHAGEVLRGGVVVELPPHVGYEVRHLVDPIDPVTGELAPWGTADQAALETELGKSRPHERVSMLEDAIVKAMAHVEHLEKLLAVAKKDEAAIAKAAKKPEEAKKVDEPKGPSKPAAATPQA